MPPRITCEFHLTRRRRHVREPGNLVRARDTLPGNGSPRLKFESKDSTGLLRPPEMIDGGYLRGTATPHMRTCTVRAVGRSGLTRVRAGAREGWARQRTHRKLLPAPPRHADSSCPVLRFRVVQVNTQAVNESIRRQECVSRS